MPIDFPNSPSVNDQFTSGTTTWRWDGSVWKVIRDFAPTGATGPTGPTGSQGNTGVTGLTGINWRAAFDFVAYSVGDVVQYSGSTYFCNTAISAGDSTSHIPGSSARWDLLSAKGNTGAQGNTGTTGPTGDDGQFSVAATTPPASPEVGDAWYDSASGNLYVYYDGYWVEAASANDGPTGNTGATGAVGQTGATGPTGDDGQFSIADTTPPAAPETGDAWYDSASGNLYVYYDGYWVEAASANDGPTGNTGATGAAGATGSTGPTGMAFAQPSEPADPQDGQIWIDTDGSVVGQAMTRWSKAPTTGTTSLTGLDDNSVTLTYTSGYEQVYRNGVLLSRGNDYTATTGTSITLVDATLAGDIIEVIGSSVLGIADVYTQNQTDAAYIGKALVDAKGDVLTATAADTPARLAVGANGTVLTADSAEATGLKWAAAGAADNYQLINTGGTALTGASTITISGISGKNRLYIESSYFITTASGPSNIQIRLNTDSGANYLYYGTSLTVGGTVAPYNGSGATEWRVGQNSNSNGYCAFAMHIDGTNAAGYKPMEFSSFNLVNPSIAYSGSGRYSGTSTITSVSIISSSGNFTGGTLYVYGA